jgi:hypothetical protein
MSAKVLIQANHTAKEVNAAVSRAWPDLHFLLLRERHGNIEEAFLAPSEKLSADSTATITLDGGMTCREASEAFRKAFGVVIEFSVESGRAVLNVPLDKAR